MKVLMISSDPAVLRQGSDAYLRMQEYASFTEGIFPLVVAGRWNIGGFWKAYQEGKSILAREGAGNFLITAQDSAERGLVAYALSRAFGTPLELQIHTDILSPHYGKESLKNKIRVFIARMILPRASCTRVVSERIKLSLVQKLGVPTSKITVLPIFVDIAKFRNLPHADTRPSFVYITVARLAVEKNIAMLLDAFFEVADKNPEAKLIVVGDGPLRDDLLRKVLASRHARRVRFEGWQEDRGFYLSQANCYVSVSNYEGYGMSIVEAAAAGLSVVTTDAGLAGDLIEHEVSGLIVPVGNREACRDAMLRIAADAGLRRQLSLGAEKKLALLPSKEEYVTRYKHAWESCGSGKAV